MQSPIQDMSPTLVTYELGMYRWTYAPVDCLVTVDLPARFHVVRASDHERCCIRLRPGS